MITDLLMMLYFRPGSMHLVLYSLMRLTQSVPREGPILSMRLVVESSLNFSYRWMVSPLLALDVSFTYLHNISHIVLISLVQY